METNENFKQPEEVKNAKGIIEKRNKLVNGSFLLFKTFVIFGILSLTIEKNYFVYYNTQAILGLIIVTSFFIFVFRKNDFIVPVFALVLIAFLEIVDDDLWRYEPFSYMFVVEDFSGVYKGVKTIDNKTLDEYNCFTDLNIAPLEFNLKIYQTGSKINIHSFSNRDDKHKIREEKSNKIIVSKLDNDTDYNLIYHYRDIGIPKNGKYSGTVNLNLKKNGDDFLIDGTYYTNGSPQTRGSLFDFIKLDINSTNPFNESRFFEN